MKTRLEEQSEDVRSDTWVDEVTLPDFDATTLDGEVWPPPRVAPRGFFSRSTPSGFEWR